MNHSSLSDISQALSNDILLIRETGHFTQMINNSFSKKIDEIVSPIFLQIKQDPFLLELSSNKLPRSKFQLYLKMDRFYLLAYCAALLRLSEFASLPNDRLSLKEFSDSCKMEPTFKIETENNDDFLGSALAQEYVDFIDQYTIDQAHYRYGLAAIFPCFDVYYRVGKELSPKSQNSEYASWFDIYKSPSFAEQTRRMTAILEKAYYESDTRQKELMEQIIRKGSLHERNFWHKAYHGLPIERTLCLR